MVYIVLVNWNGWRDTLECLESLFKLEDAEFTVVVCDNGSTDGSVEKIATWAEGTLKAEASDPRYEMRLKPPTSKPIPWIEWKPGEGTAQLGWARLVLIHAGENLGFAGGCNAGMGFALDRGDAEFLWLLNNDTVVDSRSLTQLIAKMRRESSIGICGSTLLYYFDPDTIQCRAGYRFNAWIGRVLPISEAGDAIQECDIEANLKYISGASLFVRSEVLKTVGFLNEQYFLYFEEIDLATRASGICTLGYCRDSIVYHKEGRAIGSDRSRKKRSLLSEGYLSKNRVVFTRTYYPVRLPIVLAWVTIVSMQRMVSGEYSSGKTMLVNSWKGLFQKPQRPIRPGPLPASRQAT